MSNERNRWHLPNDPTISVFLGVFLEIWGFFGCYLLNNPIVTVVWGLFLELWEYSSNCSNISWVAAILKCPYQKFHKKDSIPIKISFPLSPGPFLKKIQIFQFPKSFPLWKKKRWIDEWSKNLAFWQSFSDSIIFAQFGIPSKSQSKNWLTWPLDPSPP